MIAPNVVKKKGAGQKKQAKAKGFALIGGEDDRAKDLKEMFQKGDDDPDSVDADDKGNEGDDSLFNLVRGNGQKKAKKRKMSFIVTLAGAKQITSLLGFLPSCCGIPQERGSIWGRSWS